ncbi:MAG: AmmeMemoRadiSam system protein A [Acidobacteriota bacterium]
MLSQEQRNQLLRIARKSIEAVLEGRSAAIEPTVDDPDLNRLSGAFVSLHRPDGDLRGCIGSISAVAPLAQAVSSSAVNAAFRDPRFFPVRREELAGLHIEISVMSPIEPVVDISQIEVGRDGLIIQRNGRAGLLLPQVASERGWDRETFLDQTCVKAGLSPDSWRSPGCRIEKFSAEVFSE